MQSAEVEKVVDRSEFLNTKTRYYVHPTYRFFVGEKHYTGYTLSIPWSRWFAEEKQAQEYAKKLMATPDLKVYFDPKDPNKSCIYRGKKDGGRKFQKVGLVFALTGTFYGIFIWPILVVGLTSLIKRS